MAGSFVIGSMKVLLGADVSGFTKDMAKGKSSLNGFMSEVKGMAGAIGASLSLGAIVKGVQDIINSTAEYAKSVEDLSRSLGTNTEEASKLIQITDDLEISQSALEMGMKTALRQGITPNIEGIKGLAKEYQALSTPAEKAAFALKTFGKSGLEMQKILEKTPEQIQQMADALEGSSLVMGEDAVQAAKDYRLKLDAMNDSFQELSITVGNKVIPPATAFLELMTDLTQLDSESWFDQGADASANFINSFFNLKGAVEETSSTMSAGMGDLRAYEGAMDDIAVAADEAAGANARVAVAIFDATKAAWGKEAIDLLTKAYKDGLIPEELYEYRLREIMGGFLEMDDASIDASLALRDIREDMEEGKLSTLGAYDAVMRYADGLDSLDGKTANTYVNTTFEQRGTNYHYTPPAAQGGSSAPAPTYTTSRPEYHQFGSDFVVPGGFRENYPIGYASSGERVTVTPGGKNGNDDVIAAIKNLQMPVINERRLARAIRDAMLKVQL